MASDKKLAIRIKNDSIPEELDINIPDKIAKNLPDHFAIGKNNGDGVIADYNTLIKYTVADFPDLDNVLDIARRNAIHKIVFDKKELKNHIAKIKKLKKDTCTLHISPQESKVISDGDDIDYEAIIKAETDKTILHHFNPEILYKIINNMDNDTMFMSASVKPVYIKEGNKEMIIMPTRK
jgi:hypothetical protein